MNESEKIVAGEKKIFGPNFTKGEKSQKKIKIIGTDIPDESLPSTEVMSVETGEGGRNSYFYIQLESDQKVKLLPKLVYMEGGEPPETMKNGKRYLELVEESEWSLRDGRQDGVEVSKMYDQKFSFKVNGASHGRKFIVQFKNQNGGVMVSSQGFKVYAKDRTKMALIVQRKKARREADDRNNTAGGGLLTTNGMGLGTKGGGLLDRSEMLTAADRMGSGRLSDDTSSLVSRVPNRHHQSSNNPNHLGSYGLSKSSGGALSYRKQQQAGILREQDPYSYVGGVGLGVSHNDGHVVSSSGGGRERDRTSREDSHLKGVSRHRIVGAESTGIYPSRTNYPLAPPMNRVNANRSSSSGFIPQVSNISSWDPTNRTNNVWEPPRHVNIPPASYGHHHSSEREPLERDLVPPPIRMTDKHGLKLGAWDLPNEIAALKAEAEYPNDFDIVQGISSLDKDTQEQPKLNLERLFNLLFKEECTDLGFDLFQDSKLDQLADVFILLKECMDEKAKFFLKREPDLKQRLLNFTNRKPRQNVNQGYPEDIDEVELTSLLLDAGLPRSHVSGHGSLNVHLKKMIIKAILKITVLAPADSLTSFHRTISSHKRNADDQQQPPGKRMNRAYPGEKSTISSGASDVASMRRSSISPLDEIHNNNNNPPTSKGGKSSIGANNISAVDGVGYRDREITRNLKANSSGSNLGVVAGSAPSSTISNPVVPSLAMSFPPLRSCTKAYVSERNSSIPEEIRYQFNSAQLKATSHCSYIVLRGIGGVGKTEAAVQFYINSQGREFQRAYPGGCLFFENAENLSTYCSHIKALDMKYRKENILDLPEDASDREILAQFKRWLSERTQPWLLVIDQADNLEVLKDLLPDLVGSTIGHVLITTRIGSHFELEDAFAGRQPLQILGVKELSVEARIKFLNIYGGNVARKATEDQKNSLVASLGGLPLALKQACTYMSKNYCSVADFSSRLEVRNIAAFLDTASKKRLRTQSSSGDLGVVGGSNSVGTLSQQSLDQGGLGDNGNSNTTSNNSNNNGIIGGGSNNNNNALSTAVAPIDLRTSSSGYDLRSSVYTCWSENLKWLEEKSPMAFEFFRFISYLHSSEIPLSYMYRGMKFIKSYAYCLQFVEEYSRAHDDQDEKEFLNDLLSDLEFYSLVDRNGRPGTFRVNCLVQMYCRCFIPENDRKFYVRACIEMLSGACEELRMVDEADKDPWAPQVNQMIYHVLTLRKHCGGKFDFSDELTRDMITNDSCHLAVNGGHYLNGGRMNESDAEGDKSTELSEANYQIKSSRSEGGGSSDKIITSSSSLLNRNQKISIERDDEITKITSAAPGGSGNSALTTDGMISSPANVPITLQRSEYDKPFFVLLDFLAFALQRAGRLDEAIDLYSESLTIMRRSLDYNNPSILTTLENLYTLHQQVGDHGSANSVHMDLLQIRSKANRIKQNVPQQSIIATQQSSSGASTLLNVPSSMSSLSPSPMAAAALVGARERLLDNKVSITRL